VEVADRVCPACGAASALRGEVRRVEAGKSDTWGAKDAPDAVERLRCRACGHSWEHEE
jgi:rubrerythrin